MFLSHFLLRAYNKSRGVKMKISVCLIARNEEEVIGRCLESISVFADEIIVVDTGSIDKTKKIAGGFTEKIFDFEWINDFSAARNYAFSKACGDYLMWVDADDIAERKDGEKINELKINYSHYLLSAANYTIREICDKIVIESIPHFHRLFKKYYGTTPYKAKRSTPNEF